MDSYKNFCVYFTHWPGSPPWTDLHKILHDWSSRRRNQPCQILSQSGQGFWFCGGSIFWLSHKKEKSPLTQAWTTVQPVIVALTTVLRTTVLHCDAMPHKLQAAKLADTSPILHVCYRLISATPYPYYRPLNPCTTADCLFPQNNTMQSFSSS